MEYPCHRKIDSRLSTKGTDIETNIEVISVVTLFIGHTLAHKHTKTNTDRLAMVAWKCTEFKIFR